MGEVPAQTAAPPFRLADGTLRGFAAELLLLPTGLVTAAVLARTLGAESYGLFSLAASFVMWCAGTSTILVSRAAVKLVSDAPNWEPVASSVLRWHLVIGVCAMLSLVACAGPLSQLLGAPALAPYMRVFALDLLLFNLARAHREVLTGRGQFRAVAGLGAIRWLTRMLLLVVLVLLTGTVMAAVVGSVGATLVELFAARRYQPIVLNLHAGPRIRAVWGVVAPLLLFGTAMQLHARVDLFALSALGRPAAETGWYAAAQNLAISPSLFALSFAPLLLATISRIARAGGEAEARALGQLALRIVAATLPLAAVVAGSADEIMLVIFGASFSPAAPLLTRLFLAAVASMITTVAISVVAAARPGAGISILGVSLVVLAVSGHVLLIPHLGAGGAAMSTMITALAGAAASLLLVYTTWRIHSLATLARAAVVSVPVFLLAANVPTAHWWGLLLKLAVAGAAVPLGLTVLGELSAEERRGVLRSVAGLLGRPVRAGGGT